MKTTEMPKKIILFLNNVSTSPENKNAARILYDRPSPIRTPFRRELESIANRYAELTTNLAKNNAQGHLESLLRTSTYSLNLIAQGKATS